MNRYYHAANMFMWLSLYVPTWSIWMTRHAMMDHLRERWFWKSVDCLSRIPWMILDIIDVTREIGVLEALPANEVIDSGWTRILGEDDAKTYEEFEQQSTPIHQSSFLWEYTYSNGKRVIRLIGTGQQNTKVDHIREMENTAKVLGRTRSIKNWLIQPIYFHEHHIFEMDLTINPSGQEDVVFGSETIRRIEEIDDWIQYRENERKKWEMQTGVYWYEYLRIINDWSLETSRVFYRKKPFWKKTKPPTETLVERPLLA